MSGNTPLRYSTPQHSQVARLRQHPRPPTASSSSSPSHRTPNRNSSREGSSEDVFTATPNGRNSSYEGAQGRAATPSSARRLAKVRIVKSHKPWSQRLLSVPRDLWDRYELHLSETLSPDTDNLQELAYPAGAGCLLAHTFLRLALTASEAYGTSSRQTAHGKAGKLANTAEQRLEELRRASSGGLNKLANGKGLVFSLATSITWLLVLLSCANALYLFTRHRKYTMFLRRDPLNSPHSRTVTMDQAMQTDDAEERPSSLWMKLLAILYRITGKNLDGPVSKQTVQELSIWTPPVFALRFFSLYSPPLAIFTQFLSRSNALPFLFASACLSLQTWYLIRIYTATLNDRQLLNKEVMHEYDTKFVNPRINYARHDVGVQTNEAEFVYQNEWMPHTERGSARKSMMYREGGSLDRLPRSSTSGALGRGY